MWVVGTSNSWNGLFRRQIEMDFTEPARYALAATL
jgi:hypothetical protein